MKFIKRLISKIVQWAEQDNDAQEYISGQNWPAPTANKARSKYATIGSANSNSLDDHNNGMNFTVYSAIGGKIIQIKHYDTATDRTKSSLYIITDKENLGEELGQIITVESLSR
jgi:predicted ATP-grasp superfamily ATP-dependent carboligase